MADALLSGFLEKRAFLKENILVADVQEKRLEYMSKKFGVKTTLDNKALADELQIIILAVKPQMMDGVLQEIAPFVDDNHLFISVAAGYPISKMENFLGSDKRLVRVMPNTPSKFGVGASGFCLGKNATQEDSDSVKLMFDSVGLSYEVTEAQLDAVTGVSGSGPAYVFLFIEALADGGVKMGLPREVALKLAAQNVFGSAKMVLDTGEHPGVLKD
jgi:pyrroline-5-carboxylate reductase